MINAYVFGQYEKACQLLIALNSFLKGYGQGVSDLPTAIPTNLPNDIYSRYKPDTTYRNFYDKWSNLVLDKMGQYIKEVLASLPNQVFIEKESIEDVNALNEFTAALG